MGRPAKIKEPKLSKKEMYLGNPNLPSSEARFEYTPEMVEEIEKCKNDMLYFAENYFYIVTDNGKEVIPLYEYQKKLIRACEKNLKNIILSSRQSGKTTNLTILALHEACFKGYRNIVIVANKEDIAKTIFKRVRMAYESLPAWLKPAVLKWGEESVELANGSFIGISTTTGSAARGLTIHCVGGETMVTLRDKTNGVIFDISMERLSKILENNGELNTILIE